VRAKGLRQRAKRDFIPERATGEGCTKNLPRLGFSLPANTLSAVDLPIPFVPTSPKTCPGLGTGNL